MAAIAAWATGASPWIVGVLLALIAVLIHAGLRIAFDLKQK